MTAPAADPADTSADTGVVRVGPSDALIDVFDRMVADIPEASGDGMENILRAIAHAQTAADLDAPWQSEGITKLVGVRIRIDSARRLPSDYPEGLGWYLVCEGARLDTGELVTFTCGAVSVVGQIARAYQLGALPITAIPTLAKKPTRDGFYPIHLTMAK